MDHSLLKHYANVTHSKILENQSDIDPKDKALPAMLAWCRGQKSIVVLNNHNILCSNPLSRQVSNCKAVMLNKRLIPGKVWAADQSLIHILLENAEEEIKQSIVTIDRINAQQQRLRTLVKEALALKATDIHLEVRKNIAKIRLRRHGELIPHAEWLPKLAHEISAVAFSDENEPSDSTFNPKISQSASMTLQIEQQHVRLRSTSLPAYHGYDIVMRLLTNVIQSSDDIEQLGYDAGQIKLIKRAMNMPSGVIVVAGPTGAGKTTTLASCVKLIGEEKKVYSIEDPIENCVSSITQVPIDNKERTFASMTRTSLRMDPDVIVIGEVRDEDTANVMCRAAMTGHLVLSTVHTNSAIDIVTRLGDLGVSTSLLASPSLVICLICQRLVPLLCQHCATPITDSKTHDNLLNRWKQTFKNLKQLKVRGKGKNCHHCKNQGISSRTVIAEIIWLDAKGREYIQRGEFLAWRKHLLNNGWKSYQQRLLKMAQDGLCDPQDVEKLIGGIQPQDVSNFRYDE